MIYIFAAIIGWCGNVPFRWPFPRPRPGGDPWLNPQPEPPGEFVSGLIGMVGGVGAWQMFGTRLNLADRGLIEIAIIAFFGGVFLGSFVRGVMGLLRSPKAAA